jgi:hypothetical protein
MEAPLYGFNARYEQNMIRDAQLENAAIIGRRPNCLSAGWRMRVHYCVLLRAHRVPKALWKVRKCFRTKRNPCEQANRLAKVQTFPECNVNFKGNGVLGVWCLTSAGMPSRACIVPVFHGLKLNVYNWFVRARGSVVGWGTMLQGGRSPVRFPMRSLNFPVDLQYGPGVDLASSRNEYQESSWG